MLHQHIIKFKAKLQPVNENLQFMTKENIFIYIRFYKPIKILKKNGW